MDKLRLYDKKISKFGFHKNGAGIGENAYQVRYGSLDGSNLARLREREPKTNRDRSTADFTDVRERFPPSVYCLSPFIIIHVYYLYGYVSIVIVLK